jgi:hypothetical protein
MHKDNLVLYEKIKFLQAYHLANSAGGQAQAAAIDASSECRRPGASSPCMSMEGSQPPSGARGRVGGGPFGGQCRGRGGARSGTRSVSCRLRGAPSDRHKIGLMTGLLLHSCALLS